MKNKLNKKIREIYPEGPARNPEYFKGNTPTAYAGPGWYFQKPFELGKWTFLGRTGQEALVRIDSGEKLG